MNLRNAQPHFYVPSRAGFKLMPAMPGSTDAVACADWRCGACLRVFPYAATARRFAACDGPWVITGHLLNDNQKEAQ